MKILRLHLQNLNSLRGEWTLDFENGPLARVGLFAITGPTGAGKSTLLDAVTLALFGRAARYGAAANPEDVMTRHTGECAAEVEFACASGQFRASWRLRRARSLPEGRLQSPTRRLARLPAGDLLEEQVRRVDERVAQLTGLDYDRFLRSVLLAQGEFARFLQAKPNERAELLEQVTGGEIFRRLGQAAHQRAKLSGEALERLQDQLGATNLLPENEREALDRSVAGAETEAQARQLANEALADRLAGANAWAEWAAAGERLAEARADWAREAEAAAPALERLARHRRAQPLQPALALLANARDDAAQLAAAQTQLMAEAEARRAAHHAAAARAQEAAAQRDARAAATEAERALWAEAEALDQTLSALSATAGERRQATEAAVRARDLAANALRLAAEAPRRTAAELATLADWFAARPSEAQISARRAELGPLAERWRQAAAEAAEADDERQRAQRRADQAAAELARRRSALPDLAAALAEAEARLAKAEAAGEAAAAEGDLETLRREREAALARRTLWDRLLTLSGELREAAREEVQRRQDRGAAERRRPAPPATRTPAAHAAGAAEAALEGLRQQRDQAKLRQSLQGHRSELRPGEPCPLCGALHHPWAQSPADEALERARLAFEAAEEAHAKARREFRAAAAAEQSAQAHTAAAAAALTGAENHLNARRGAWAAAASALDPAPNPDDPAALRAGREAADQAAARALARQNDLQAALAAALTARDHRQERAAALENARRALAAQQELQGREAEHLAAAAARHERGAAAVAWAGTAFREALSGAEPPPDSPAGAAAVLQRLADREREFARRERLRAELAQRLAGEESALAAAVQALAAPQARRQALLGGRPVAEVRRAAEQALAAWRTRADELQQSAAQAAQALAQTEAKADELRARQAHRAEELERQQAAADASATAVGFTGATEAAAAVLAPAAALALEQLAHALDQRRTRLEAEASAQARRGALLPPTSAADHAQRPALEEALRDGRQALHALWQQIGARREQLRDDDARRARAAELQRALLAAQAAHGRADRLSRLIGSAEGDKFARFAQGLTLRRLAALANRHCQRLHPRYSLRAYDLAQETALEVVDHHQGDATRPTASLSGGEAFLTALALALALSDLSSGRHRIDSLFIDEGFGALDSQTLDTVVDALDNLQATGKTIGVISHVAAMQERIPLQVRVQKQAGGHSQLKVCG